MNKLPFIYNDGGRKAAGFKGDAGDCVARAIAIATNLDYRMVYVRGRNEVVGRVGGRCVYGYWRGHEVKR